MGSRSDQIDVVPVVEAELGHLFGLAKTAFADLSGWSDRRVLDILTSDVVFVAHEDGEPAGYIALHCEDDRVAVVDQLLVAAGHEGRGVGRRLLAHAEGFAIAERTGTLRIVVEEGNDAARSFYRRSGFVPVATELFELVLPRRP